MAGDDPDESHDADSERARNDQGRFDVELTDERVLEAFRAASESNDPTDPVMSARTVADHLGCSRQGADRKLRELADRGIMDKHDLGPRNVAWTVVTSEIDE